MRGWLVALLAVMVGFAGCIGTVDDAQTASVEEVEDEEPDVPHKGSNVVIAVIDTGINLYHEEYRAEDRWPARGNASGNVSQASNPAGPPVDVAADPAPVDLDLERSDWASAVEADRARLDELETETLYTFPGTKVLGGISFSEPFGDWPVLLDRPGGHGTMTSSRAVGNQVSIPGEDPGVWLVMVQGFTPDAVDWAAEQGWIDMVSISSGLSIGGVVPGAANVAAQDAIRSFEEASHAKPLFASSGNGAGNVGVAGFPSWLRGASGVPDAFSVGATDNGNLAQWDNQDSYIAADGCSNPAARADAIAEIANHGGGTSSATPFSAGGAAKVLLEARRTLNDTGIGPRYDENRSRPEGAWASGHAGDAQVVLAEGEAEGIEAGPLADGTFTMRELKDVVYHTALETPTEDESDGEECGATRNGNPFGAGYVPAESVPEDARFPFQGYGEVNDDSIATAIDVLHGEAELPERPTDDWHYERAHSHKQTFVSGEPTLPPAPGQG
jgi:hypothetical protein